jgi:U4/U6 small nuclear ribonucleoprotein PRP3
MTRHFKNLDYFILLQGQTKERHFSKVKFKQCPTESFAREHLKKSGVELDFT